MKQLLYKEFRLCFVLQIPIFFLFVLMLLIPSYPYLVSGFFICNAIFYSFSQGLADNDLLFTVLLPISKAEAVKGKLWFVICVQMLAFLLYIPMILVRRAILPDPNMGGLDPSVTLLAALLVLFGVFNLVMIPRYYRDAHKVGKHFLVGVIWMFVWITVVEGTAIAAGAARDALPLFAWIETHLDCFPTDAGAWTAQGIALLIGAGAYALLNLLTYRRSVKAFDGVNL